MTIAPRLVESASRLAAACRERGALVLVDTTGLIGGELGVGLKLAKIRAVAAAHVVAIQREEECEPILSRLDGVAIHRLTPSPLARTRTPEARSRARQDKLAAYFAAAGDAEHILETDKVALFRLNQPASLVHQELSPGTVLGLCHHDETLGLGLATEADKRSITLRTPLKSLKGVNRALFGDIVLGKE